MNVCVVWRIVWMCVCLLFLCEFDVIVWYVCALVCDGVWCVCAFVCFLVCCVCGLFCCVRKDLCVLFGMFCVMMYGLLLCLCLCDSFNVFACGVCGILCDAVWCAVIFM